MAGGTHSSGWTVAALDHLRQLNRLGGDLDQLAEMMGTTRRDIDWALWMMLGRTPAEALEAMKRREAA
ncbi:hypothetical protein [Caulobacter endophyticus]|uniref:Uncharacterized protein n=1 Tax=Caulobacter endophyticus TaxID=2172652 RepID=A0A2T9K3W6_9CAUL|nr:hypothetical protein [Caulobacter endophyticus]PVM90676.1 hypothetical protein DDF67_09610 [Caulobacter endophyticus]